MKKNIEDVDAVAEPANKDSGNEHSLMEFHPIASTFPLPSDEEIEEILADIEKNGLIEPAVVYEGKILDGRGRAIVCKMLKRPLLTKEYDGSDPLEFVTSKNLKRRHLTTSQRAAIASERVDWTHGGDRKSKNIKTKNLVLISLQEAVNLFRVSDESIRQAQKVREKDEEVFQALKSGKINLQKAVRITLFEPKRRKAVLEKIGRGVKAEESIWEAERAETLEKRQVSAPNISAQKPYKKVEQIGNATLFLGDMFEIAPTLNEIIDLVLSDPPYGITDEKKRGERDEKIDLEQYWNLVPDLCVPEANHVLFGMSDFLVDLLVSRRAWMRHYIQWFKDHKSNHRNSNSGPLHQHETIVVFAQEGYKSKAFYDPQQTYEGQIRIRRAISEVGDVYGEIHEYANFLSDEGMYPIDVLYFEDDRLLYPPSLHHPTQKPVALMNYLIRTYCPEGGIVFDPFMGSGSTGVAALQTHRRFFGIERDEKYFRMACERCQAQHDGTSLQPALPDKAFRKAKSEINLITRKMGVLPTQLTDVFSLALDSVLAHQSVGSAKQYTALLESLDAMSERCRHVSTVVETLKERFRSKRTSIAGTNECPSSHRDVPSCEDNDADKSQLNASRSDITGGNDAISSAGCPAEGDSGRVLPSEGNIPVESVISKGADNGRVLTHTPTPIPADPSSAAKPNFAMLSSTGA